MLTIKDTDQPDPELLHLEVNGIFLIGPVEWISTGCNSCCGRKTLSYFCALIGAYQQQAKPTYFTYKS